MDDTGVVETTHRTHRGGIRGFEGQSNPVTLGIDQYVWVFRRQWVVIVLITLLGIISAGAYLFVTPRSVVATTTLNLSVIMTEPFSSQRPASGLLDGPTEADIARSHVVAMRAAILLGSGATPTEIRSASEISSGASATVLKVMFTAPSQKAAVEGANAVASAYLAFRSDQADARVATIVSALTEQIDSLNEQLNEANTVIASTPPQSSQHVQALTQQQQVLTELDGLLTERNALRSVDTTGGIVLSDAENNPVYVLPSRLSTLLLGAAAGLVLGVAVAFMRNPFDHRVRGAKEMSRLLRAPVLTESPVRGHGSRNRLRLAQERILTDMSPGGTLLVIDTTSEGDLSSTSHRLVTGLEDAQNNVQVLTLRSDEPATIIAALRTAHAAVVVFDQKAARVRGIRWFASEAAVSETHILGVIEHFSSENEGEADTVSDRAQTS